MSVSFLLLAFLAAALIAIWQLGLVLGRARACQAGIGAAAFLAILWGVLASKEDETAISFKRPLPATSASCFKCHESHHATWHASYHRTMTREATPEFVKADFHDAVFDYEGVRSRMTRRGDEFFMETADPSWAEAMAQSGKPPHQWGPPQVKEFKIDRLVGSHWFQEFMHKDRTGRYVRLPLSYHLVEHRWIHTNGAFLAPDTDDFWSKSSVWNESCVYCHNTKPSKNPEPPRPGVPGPSGYKTEVAELGIACEACHGPGGQHVEINQNPARRFSVRLAEKGDGSIVNPLRLPVERADAICAHCHGGHVPLAKAWNLKTMADPYNAGDDLKKDFTLFWSELDQRALYQQGVEGSHLPSRPEPLDGRFWGDGTPLTTALEYQGMALSACYEEGNGGMRCTSCHSMHKGNPHFQLAPSMEKNDACYSCHDSYRGRLVEHTHHPAGSSGSLCYNCHMPFQVYSLLTAHRSHRIAIPRIKDSLGTGKPNACNLCHLDRSLGWTQDHLGKWYNQVAQQLSKNEQEVSSALLHLCQSDARSRAVVAAAFSWPPAQEASGTDWAGPLLLKILENERYPAVRYLAHRGLRAQYGLPRESFNYLADAQERKKQLESLGAILIDRCRPEPGSYPNLPLTPKGQFDRAFLDSLLLKRNDPDVVINE